jgi:hypothetical protein
VPDIESLDNGSAPIVYTLDSMRVSFALLISVEGKTVIIRLVCTRFAPGQ